MIFFMSAGFVNLESKETPACTSTFRNSTTFIPFNFASIVLVVARNKLVIYLNFGRRVSSLRLAIVSQLFHYSSFYNRRT